MKLFIFLVYLLYFVKYAYPDCAFPHENQETLSSGQKMLNELTKVVKRISVTDAPNKYMYEIGLCVSARIHEADSTVGVYQTEIATKAEVVVGRISNADVIAGKDWLFLEYANGDAYPHSCGQEKRTAKIMFTCAPGVTQPRAQVVEENKNKSSSCYYLFEVALDALCPVAQPEPHKLGPGSVICIVFLVLVGVYLIGGALYQRIVVGAKGMEQIPNYAFWQDFGSLQADGCDFVCRSSDRRRGGQEYRGIGDNQIHSSQPESTPDDNLLPM